jgi:hypothetical protein
MPEEFTPCMERKTKALDYFKDWSNYLLITTVAALGWVTKQETIFYSLWLKYTCIALLAFSVIFAILTLALIPHVSEYIKEDSKSIYDVKVQYYLFGRKCLGRLKWACFPQHLSFLLGIIVYAFGTALGK